MNNEQSKSGAQSVIEEALVRFLEYICESLEKTNDELIFYQESGDEFVLVLPDVYTDEEILICTEKIKTAFAGFSLVEGVKLSASFGVARYPKDGASFKDLFAKADKALYAAKKNQRGETVIYQDLK